MPGGKSKRRHRHSIAIRGAHAGHPRQTWRRSGRKESGVLLERQALNRQPGLCSVIEQVADYCVDHSRPSRVERYEFHTSKG